MTAARLVLTATVIGCGHRPVVNESHSQTIGPLAQAANERMIAIPAGRYVSGSTVEERQAAYDDHAESSGGTAARTNQWFDFEDERRVANLPAFRIDIMPVTQAEFAEFVAAGRAPPPAIDEAAWQAQGFAQPYTTVQRFVWTTERPPTGREDHPVVLVTQPEAAAYCAWRGGRLPTSSEFEKAARGDGGLAYPWGAQFEATRLNCAVGGPLDTVAVGSFSSGASPYGVLDMAGNVFQWTATPSQRQPGRIIVRGSSWEDFAGFGRAAALHGRAPSVRHVIVGFRCAADAP